MATPLGIFDEELHASGWFDSNRQVAGWFDEDLIDTPATPGAAVLTANPGSVAITGVSVALKFAHRLAVNPGSVAVAGSSTALVFGRRLTASPGSVATSGVSVGLRTAKRLAVNPGSVSSAGQSVGLKRGAALAVSPGSVAITGQSTTLTRTTVGLTLTANPASVSIAGQDATLSIGLASSGSSGVARLIAAQDWYWNPKPAVVTPFAGMPKPEARKTATAPVAQPKPQTFDLLEALSEAERETVDAESKLRVVDEAAAQVVDALRRMAKVAALEKQAVQLDVVREAKKRAAIRKRIQAEDEMIIMALLAA